MEGRGAARYPDVERGVILWRSPLTVGFLAEFNSFQTVVAPQQVVNFSSGIIRRVVQHTDWHEHRQVVGEFATENEIQSGLLGVVVDVFSAMPRISGGCVNDCLPMSVAGVADVGVQTTALVAVP